MITTSTVYDVISNSLQYLGAISYGESIDPAMSKTAILGLNSIRKEWSKKLLNYKPYDQTYIPTSASPSKQFITLGSTLSVSGDILTRPADITNVYIMFGTTSAVNNYEIPIKSIAEYRANTIQNMFTIPNVAYIDNDFPLQKIYFYPGLGSGYSVRVLGKSYFDDYENVSDTFIDAPEFFTIYSLALALRLAPMFGTDPNTLSGILQMLNSASHPIKTENFRRGMKRTKSDLNIGSSAGGFNFLSGNL